MMKTFSDKVKFKYFSAVGLFLGMATMRAQDSISVNQMEEVVITKYYQKYKENNISSSFKIMKSDLEFPQHLSIIPAKVLEDQQILNFGEGVTRNVSGARKVEHWDQVYTRVYMRGAPITPLLNGVNAAYLPNNLVPPDASITERVEFVKGPLGMVGSMGDPAGFYNIVLKKPRDRKHLKAGFTTGSFDLYRGEIDLGGNIDKNKNILFRMNAMLSDNHSWVDYDFTKKLILNPSLTLKPFKTTSLTAQYIYQQSEFAQPAAYLYSPFRFADLPVNFSFNDPDFRSTKVKDHMFFLSLDQHLAKNWDASIQYGSMDYDHDGSNWGIYPFGELTGGTPTSFNRYIAKWVAKAKNRLVQGYITGKVDMGFSKHLLVAGIDFTDKKYQGDFSPFEERLFLFDSYKPVYGIGQNLLPTEDFYVMDMSKDWTSDMKHKIYSYYIMDDIDMLDNKLHLNFTARFTKGSIGIKGTVNEEEHVTTRFGANYTITKDFSVYALRDETFIPQSGLFVEIAQDNQRTFIPFNKPQTGTNLEFGIKKDWNRGRWNTVASVYRIKRENQLGADKRFFDVVANILYSSITTGFEFDMKGEVAKGLNAIVNYAYTDSKISESMFPETVGQPGPGLARHMQNTWLDYTLPKKWINGLSIKAGYQYHAQRFPWFLTSLENQIRLPDLLMVSAGLGYRYKHYSANFIVNNVFNKIAYNGFKDSMNYFVYMYEPPRNWRLTLTYQF